MDHLAAWWDEQANARAFKDVDFNDRSYRYAVLHWKCPQKGHSFQRLLRAMKEPQCPTCKLEQSGQSLASRYPYVAKRWHPSLNEGLLPKDVQADFDDEVWWSCLEGHAFKRSPREMVKNDACPRCKLEENSLAKLRPRLAQMWHPEKNAGTTPEDIAVDENMPAWWICNKGHEFTRTVRSMSQGADGKCPICYKGWSVERIKEFVRSLLDNIDALDPSEIFSLAMQAGAFKSGGAYRFALAISSGQLPKEELQKFVDGEESQIDTMTEDGVFELEQQPDIMEPPREADPFALPADPTLAAHQTAIGLEADALERDSEVEEDDSQLPLVETTAALKALSKFAASADLETVQFLIDSALAKLWRHAFKDEQEAQAQAEAFDGQDAYSKKVRDDFLRQLQAANALVLPQGYAFKLKPGGPIVPPLLMQRHVAVCLAEKQCFGNWSGMGAGKTMGGILATRVVGADLTVVCCPNSVVDNWIKEIRNTFADVQICSKTWQPQWMQDERPRYLIMNFEQFQQPDSEARMVGFLEKEQRIDAIIIDEIHFAKQRSPSSMSRRKRLVQGMRLKAQEHNPELYVLGMSGTPVINELQEGKSLIELITGRQHADLQTKATVQNCMKLYQKLVTHGTRWQPDYAMVLNENNRPMVDCSEYLDEIRRIGARKGSPLDIERVLTQARLPEIVRACQPGTKTLVYTHYVDGIVKPIREALVHKGLKVGIFTGQTDDADLRRFIDPQGDCEVLIASSRVSTGVDGLQHVCGRLVINVLPWTRAEYDQLKGRLWRQGSTFEQVDVIVPVTYADLTGGRWSYCQSKIDRLEYKKSIADAAVDGRIPTGTLRTPAQAQRDILQWLDRLEDGGLAEISRPPIKIPLSDEVGEVNRRNQRYGDFTRLNNRWYQSNSQTTHQRLQDNPEEWAHYHTMYRQSRQSWDVVPFEEEIEYWGKRHDLTLADFGCGEALIAKALGETHRIYSFDHVAIDDDVVACDMRQVPILDEELDGAIFCLSLMGSNITEYILEARRCLKLDGVLRIWETKGRMKNEDAFVKDLQALGFDVFPPSHEGGCVLIRAIKNAAEPRDVRLTL